MKKSSGFALIVILIALAVLTITAGGVVIWEKKILPTPTPILQILPTPTTTRPWTQSCTTDNDCPKQMCQPAGTPCAQYYCIQGKCQLVEPPIGQQGGITGSLGEKIKLTPGQTVNIKGTDLSISLLEIVPPPEGSFDYPTKAELEVRSGNQSEKIYFIAGVLATQEVAAKLRTKEVFGFKITYEELRFEWIILSVQKL